MIIITYEGAFLCVLAELLVIVHMSHKGQRHLDKKYAAPG